MTGVRSTKFGQPFLPCSVHADMSEPLQTYYDGLKSEHGGFAAIAWLICGAIVFYQDPATRLISWQALVYVIVGLLVVPLVIGGLSYLTMRTISRALMLSKVVTAPTHRAQRWLTLLGWTLFAVQAVFIYLLSRWAVRAML
jgi:hypothetical protein